MLAQLKEAIAASGKTLVELSQTTDVSPSQLSRFLRGERDLTFASAARVCEALGLRLVGPTARPPTSSSPERPKRGRKAKGK